MSAIKALDLREQESGVVVATTPKLTVISGGRSRVKHSRNLNRYRSAHVEHLDVAPEGTILCRRCAEVITYSLDDDIVCCSNGHSFNLSAEEAEYRETRSWTHSGLSQSQVGEV